MKIHRKYTKRNKPLFICRSESLKEVSAQTKRNAKEVRTTCPAEKSEIEKGHTTKRLIAVLT
jgi:hypothetical protein